MVDLCITLCHRLIYQSPPPSCNSFNLINLLFLFKIQFCLPHRLLLLPTDRSLESSTCQFHLTHWNNLGREAIDFQVKLGKRSGIGGEACMPLAMHELPHDSSPKSTLEEVKTVLFTAVQDLFSKHDINPESIDILVLNYVLFCPTPSITATKRCQECQPQWNGLQRRSFVYIIG